MAYAGQTLFAKASDVSLADAPDRAAYRGVTLRRTDLYASPDDSQAPADFFWGGVVLSGFSRWDAAGGWLAVAYAGQTLFAKASDVSLNDAPGRDAPLRRADARPRLHVPGPGPLVRAVRLLLGRRGGPRRPVGRRRGVGCSRPTGARPRSCPRIRWSLYWRILWCGRPRTTRASPLI